MSDAAPKTLAEALAALQAQLPRVAKEHTAKVETKTGGNYKYAYADLTDVSAALLPVLSSLGLSFSARPTMIDGQFLLLYTLMHVEGNEMTGRYPLPDPNRLGPQDLGKAITYARRYALCAITGLAPGGDDDDAQASERAHQDARQPRNIPDAQLDAQGRMTRSEKSAHEHLATDTVRGGGKADRSHPRGPDPDDPWASDEPVNGQRAAELRQAIADATPEDRPGSSNGKQHQQLGILYQQLGITERDHRLHDMTDRLGRAITSAKDLSYAEAETAIRELRDLVAAERGAELESQKAGA